MKRYDGVLICSDFDGTVFCGERQEISVENAEAIRYFQERGGRFTLATGRYPNILEKKADKVRGVRVNAPVIAANGCLVYDFESEKTLYSATLGESFAKDLPEILGLFDDYTTIDFFRTHEWSSLKLPNGDIEPMIKECLRDPHKIYLSMKLPEEPEAALRESDRLRAKMDEIVKGRYEVIRASVVGLEILPLGVSKGSYVRKLANSLGCDKLVCVGDYENDITMIKEADIGYAMGNAYPSLFDIADRIAPRVEENAIAKIIYEL